MKLAQFRRTNFGLAAALIVFLALAFANGLNWFRWTDDLLRDSCFWLTPSSKSEDQILLVYAPPSTLETASPQLVSFIEAIQKQSPKKVAIQANGSISDFEPLNRVSNVSSLTVGFPLNELLASPKARNKNTFRTGFIDLHHSGQAIYRNGIVATTHTRPKLNSFEFEIVKSVSPLSGNMPALNYGIRYRGGPNTLPHIDADSLLKGNLTRELIKDKIVLIGPKHSGRFAMLTPTTWNDSRMSRLEIRGNMVASLLNENYATDFASIPSLILLAFVTLISFHLARQTKTGWLPTVILAMTAVLLGLFAVCYWLTSIWLPATALIFAGLVSAIVTTTRRFSKLEDSVQFWKMRSTMREAHTKDRFQGDKWEAIGDITYQMFQPTRIVMMELLPEATHLKRVRSIGCDYSQILEKRLDYKRSPYWDAIQSRQPVQSPNRGFFTSNPGVREVEYFLPLVNGINTYGVMALAMDVATLEKWHDFDSFLAHYCTEISHLVAGSVEATKDNSKRAKLIEHCCTLPEERAFAEIQNNSLLQEDLMERVDIAFDCSESAMATFDIYGHIIRRNSNLNRLLQKTELASSRPTCIDIISAFSGQPLNDARRTFRDAVLHNKNSNHLIVDAGLSKAPMMMYIKPMQLQEDESRTSIETRGLLLEIVDGRSFQEIQQWNHELSNAKAPEVLRRTSKLQHEVSLLKEPSTGNQALNDLFGSVGETVSEIVSVLETCRVQRHQVTESPENFFLVDTTSVWKSVKHRFEVELTQRSISIHQDDSIEGEIKAFANPILLDRAFSKILEFLLDNAFDESVIQLDVVPQIDGFEFRFTNQGGGTPVDTLRKSLDQAANKPVSRRSKKYLNLDTAQIDQLQQIDTWVEHWNGGFSVQNLPHCITASLTLSKIPVAAPENLDSVAAPTSLEGSENSPNQSPTSSTQQ